jgi:hypothetical protein
MTELKRIVEIAVETMAFTVTFPQVDAPATLDL